VQDAAARIVRRAGDLPVIRPLALTLAAAALLSPLAAGAAETARDADAEGMARVAETMRNPAAQAAMGEAMGAMIGAILEMPAAPFLKAADAAETASGAKKTPRDIKRNAKLRDLAGADAAETPRQVARAVPVMMGGMAGMTETMGKMLPQLREMGAKMAEAMGKAVVDAKPADPAEAKPAA
jgi:hypothetical protein